MNPLRFFQAQLPQLVVRGLNVKQDLPATIAPDLRVTALMEDLSDDEFFYLRGGRLQSVWLDVPPVAAQFAFAQFGVLAAVAGKTMAIVSGLTIHNTSAAINVFKFGVGASPAAVTLASSVIPRDDRNQNVSACRLEGGNNAALILPTGTAIVPISINQILSIPLPFVMTGNQLLIVAANAVNVGFSLRVDFRERTMEATERVTS